MTNEEQQGVLLSMMHHARGYYRRKPISPLAGATKRPHHRTRVHRLEDAHYYATADKRCPCCGYSYPHRYRELWDESGVCAFCAAERQSA